MSATGPAAGSAESAVATLGGGCFWCLEAVFRRAEGVLEVTSGYAGGHVSDPSYRQVLRGDTGHAEVVQVRFDPTEITYRELLEIFFEIHDPTTPDRQGADVGPQYRSIILWLDEDQRTAAGALIEELAESGGWDAPIVTEVVPLERFWPAEAEHHEYYERNANQAYCRFVVAPKLKRARDAFPQRVVR